MTILNVFIVRHEAAHDAMPDATRTLTDEGRRRARITARLVASDMTETDVFMTSPLPRALQTAEIFAAEIGFDGRVTVVPELADPPSLDAVWANILAVDARVRGVAVFGHEPTWSALLATVGIRVRGVRRGEVYALAGNRHRRDFRFVWRMPPGGPARIEDWSR